MVYNINLNSPQLAYQKNIKLYYFYVIQQNKKRINKIHLKYLPIYTQTSYDRIITPNEIIISN